MPLLPPLMPRRRRRRRRHRRLQYIPHIRPRAQLSLLKRAVHQLTMFDLASLQVAIDHFAELDRAAGEEGGVGDVALGGGAADDVGGAHRARFDGRALEVRVGDGAAEDEGRRRGGGGAERGLLDDVFGGCHGCWGLLLISNGGVFWLSCCRCYV